MYGGFYSVGDGIVDSGPVVDENSGESEDGDGWFSSFGDWFSDLGLGIAEGLEAVTSGISGAIKGVVSGITSLGDRIGGFFTSLLEGIGEFFADLLSGIGSLLEDLFVPSDNLGNDLKEKIYAKFPFIEQIVNVVSSLLDIGKGAEQPNFSITWYGTTVKIIDFTLVEDYLPVIHTIIVAVCWGTFLIRLYKRIPSIIGGFR